MIQPIGLSFGLRRQNYDVFCLGILGDKDAPIRSDGRIISFEDENLCRNALMRLEPLLPVGIEVKHDYDFICDLSGAIQLIMEEDIDRDAIMLNCINTVLDLVTTSPFDLPAEYRILLSLADRLTFKEEFGEFMQVRASIRNALLWCAGLTITQLMLIPSLTEFERIISSLSVTQNK